MKCPYCGHLESKVLDSRVSKELDSIKRKRECLKCTKRFMTSERVEENLPLVVKKDGRREAFDRTKILNGLKKACEKRPVSIASLEKIVSRIEYNLLEKGEREVSAKDIGEMVMDELRKLDEIAYVRFASVYRQFKDINEFMEELKDLLLKKEQIGRERE
ncbi:MAG: transcriptional regulator NrdR [Deltaproteobacteria bacterium]|nr:transcriptional regulator NrdR [Deltaproteobacteria bacterium]